MREEWNDATTRVKNNPGDCKIWTKVCVDGTHSSSLLPLHQACSLKPPVNIITELIKAYPKSVRTKESFFSRIPLHIACLRGASLEVINACLLCYSDGARAKAVFDRLPLHYACGSGSSKEIILSLIAAYPDGPKSQDEHGWLPLHLACFYNASPSVIQTLIEAYPNSVNVTTKKGKTPVQCIKLKNGKQNDKVIALLRGAAAFSAVEKREHHQQHQHQQLRDNALHPSAYTQPQQHQSPFYNYGNSYGIRRTNSLSSVESEYDFVPSDSEVC